MKAIFDDLGAPLHNVVWSWGAVRPQDGAVILRVWQGDSRLIDGKRCIWVGHMADKETTYGEEERRRHIDRIREGAKSYLVIVRPPESDDAGSRTGGVNTKSIFVGGELVEYEDSIWLHLADRIPMHAARL